MKPGVLPRLVSGISVINHNLKGIWTRLSNSTGFPWGTRGMMPIFWNLLCISSIPSSWGQGLGSHVTLIWCSSFFNLITWYFGPWRMPTAWISTMTKFVKEYEREAWTMVRTVHHFVLLTCISMFLWKFDPWNIWNTAVMLLAGSGWRRTSCTAHGTSEEGYIARVTWPAALQISPHACSNTPFGFWSHHLNKKCHFVIW